MKVKAAIFILLMRSATAICAEAVTVDEFIAEAVKKDTAFESILVDELKLKYGRTLALPARDLIVSLKGQYDLYESQNRDEGSYSLSLSKLFPESGSSLTGTYTTASSSVSYDNSSSFTFVFSQPIAQNAFGRQTRLLGKITDIAADLARYQIVEAYEDYLAAVFKQYYDWYQSYQELKIAESSYKENTKLLDNIKQRQKNSIALAVDVNKIEIQVLAKKEKLVELQNEYDQNLAQIKKILRYDQRQDIAPVEPGLYALVPQYMPSDYAVRTVKTLTLMKKSSALNVDYAAEDLLPSVELFAAYNVSGTHNDIRNELNKVYAGVKIDLSLTDSVDRAEYDVAMINDRKTGLSVDSISAQLKTDIEKLFSQIKSEEMLLSIAASKVRLAEDVLKDETENYSYGKISLNDYISAVNLLDANRFSQQLHSTELRRLIIEWLRITDTLVVETPHAVG